MRIEGYQIVITSDYDGREIRTGIFTEKNNAEVLYNFLIDNSKDKGGNVNILSPLQKFCGKDFVSRLKEKRSGSNIISYISHKFKNIKEVLSPEEEIISEFLKIYTNRWVFYFSGVDIELKEFDIIF